MCASVLVCDTLYICSVYVLVENFICLLLIKSIFNTIPFLFLGFPTSHCQCFHYKSGFSDVYDLVIKHHIGAGSCPRKRFLILISVV